MLFSWFVALLERLAFAWLSLDRFTNITSLLGSVNPFGKIFFKRLEVACDKEYGVD
jgi:hypothetical protein